MSSPSPIVNLRELRQSCADCALSQLCLPASIGGDDLERLDHVVKQRVPLERGDMVFHEGAHHPALYIVRSGSLKTYTTLPEGDVQILGFHIAGELVGLDGLAGSGFHPGAGALLAIPELISLIINIFLFAILIQVILSWINPGTLNPAVGLIHSLTEPLLGPVRRRMPDMGGLDLSPMVVMLGLVVLEMLLIPPVKDLVVRLM